MPYRTLWGWINESDENRQRYDGARKEQDEIIYTPTTTYPFVISKRTGMSVIQVADKVLYTGLIEMQKLDAPG